MGSRGVVVFGLAAIGLFLTGSSIAACVGDEAAPASSSSNQTNDASTDGPINPNSLKAGGIPCGAAGECQSAQCSDGVCCDAPCNGTCESCKLPGSVGRCTPVADGQDPDKECLTVPLPDLTAIDAGVADAGDDDGAVDAGVDAGDGGPAAPAFTAPDGGFPSVNQTTCGGSCNGARACKYPAVETTCGDSFCGNKTQVAKALCDGAGHCLYGIQSCTGYSCEVGASSCKTTCTKPTDCQDDFYCDGPTNTCKPRSADGVGCQADLNCQSGYCIGGVCCNTACESAAGGTCSSVGHVGECTCSACPGGTCQLFYQDLDNDGYGDINATLATNTAKFACKDAPPAGFSADHTDCFDAAGPLAATAKLVHPGQGGWFDTGYTIPGSPTPSFDYDCDGQQTKQTTDNGSCTTCTTEAFMESAPITINPFPINTCNIPYHPAKSCGAVGAHGYHDCYCLNNKPFFFGNVGCGVTTSSYTCGTCTTTTGVPPAVGAGSLAQSCH